MTAGSPRDRLLAGPFSRAVCTRRPVCWPRRRSDRTSRNRPPGPARRRRCAPWPTGPGYRRRVVVPHQTEARELTSTENIHNTPAAPELEHSETGAPAPEELEQQVKELGGAPVASDSPLFSDFDVHPDIVAALAEVGITRTFAIQELTLPLALAGHDLIGQARTGTGKTLGFGVPMLQRVTPPAEGGDGVPQALVVVPTRELCVQVSRDPAAAGARRGIRVQAIYGGRAFEPQIESLQKGVEI